MKRPLFFILLVLLGLGVSQAQNITLSGYVYDEETGESLIGATIYIPSIKAGTYSNSYGFYSLSVPPGEYEVQYRFVGYASRNDTVQLEASLKQDVRL
ncbi:MAG: carboxypeptidase-like regulatory domain-containing protein [Bacteroidota bacterium]